MAKGNHKPATDEPLKTTETPDSIIASAKEEAGNIVQAAHDKAEVIIKDSTDAADKIKEDAEADALKEIDAGDKVAEETIAKANEEAKKIVGAASNEKGDELDSAVEVDGVASDRCWRYNGGVETGKIFAKGEVIPDGWTKKFTK